MPYIGDQKFRRLYDGFIVPIINVLNKAPKKKMAGHLNYIITKLLISTNPNSYTEFNDLVGVLESVKLEFYRREIVPYEDKKIIENGDVYNDRRVCEEVVIQEDPECPRR